MPTREDRVAKIFHRHALELLPVTRAAGDATDPAAAESDLIHCVISTETPCDDWGGTYILSHASSAVDMSYARDGLPLLIDHGGYPDVPNPDPASYIGSVVNIKLVNNRLEGDLSFARHALAQQWRQMVIDKHVRRVSVRAHPLKRKVVESPNVNDGTRQVTWTRWRPEEVSLPVIAADPAAKIRSASSPQDIAVETEYETAAPNPSPEEPAMPQDKPNPEPTPAAPAAEPSAVRRASDGGGGVATLDRDDVARITELCISNNCAELLPDFVRRGLSSGEVGLEILDRRGKAAKPAAREHIPASAEELGASKKDIKRFSVTRALNMALEVSERRRAVDEFDGIEGELHKELVKRMPMSAARHGGIIIPLRMEREDVEFERDRRSRVRALGSGVAGGGAELVFDRAMDMVELLTNRALVANFGAQIYTGLANTIQFPKETSDVDVTFMGENPASDAPATQPGFGVVEMSGKTLIGNVLIPKQLMALSSIDVENRVRFRLMNKHGLKTDWAALYGPGTSGMPTGLYNTPGVQVKNFASAAIDFDGLVDMEALVADTNADVETMAYMTSIKQAAKFKKTLVKAAAGSERIWVGRLRDAEMNGYRAGATKQVSSTMSGLAETGGAEQGCIFGDWSQLSLGYWGGFEVTVDNLTQAAKGQVRVVTYQMFDTVVTRPEAFCVAQAAIIP